MEVKLYTNPMGGRYVPPAAKSVREGKAFSARTRDQVEISPEGRLAVSQGTDLRGKLEDAVENGDMEAVRKAAKEMAGTLEGNWNAAVDPDGTRYAAAYVEALVGQYEKARGTIEAYYAEAHRENLTFENPSNHIIEKYKLSTSPYFRKDLSQDQREMAFRQEQALLFGGRLTLNDPYALADSGGVLLLEDVDRMARQAAQDKIGALVRERQAKDAEAAQETEEDEETEGTSTKSGGRVAFNEGKRARQLAAAASQDQVQQVLALLQKDLSDCEAGLSQGMCDEAEVAKVRAMIQRAHQRMAQVPKEAEGTGGLDAFAMASLL